MGIDPPKRRQFSLVLYHRNGVQVVPLEVGQSVVVGRTAPADCIVPEEELSRRHARFSIEEGQVNVEDLGSTNGTWLRGERVNQATVPEGETVKLGSVKVDLQVYEESVSPFHRLSGHEQFVTIVEEETFRARAFKRNFVVIMAKGLSEDLHLGHWFQNVRRYLRPVDRAAVYAPDTLEIGLPEAGLGEAVKLVNAMIAATPSGLGCGIAVFPESGTSYQALIEAARSAVGRATQKSPIQIAADQSAQWPEPRQDQTGPVILNPKMRALYAMVDKLAATSVPVLIHGETGTGKELVARAIHERSDRRAHRICCVNCGAIPEQLVESFLFGHERGAFSGADQAQIGVFEEANGGTVLLDEIGELPLSAQAALLRVLETKRITRVGSNEERELDVRVIAATHCDLVAMCRAGTFREDVWYRLNTVVLELPPLRDRPEEIPALVQHFIQGAETDRELFVDDDAMEMLEVYAWPGNVRELRNVIERAIVLAHGSIITASDLPQRIREGAIDHTATHMSKPASGPHLPVDTLAGSFKDRVAQFETQLIAEALEAADGNQTQAAKRLRIPLRTLVRKIKAYGLG